VVLFYWDGIADLVKDSDYVYYGATGANTAVDKTGASADGPDGDAIATAYANDTADAAGRHAPVATSETCRADFAETGQTSTGGGNGVAGEDETSENDGATWRACGFATPNAASVIDMTVAPSPVTIHVAMQQQFTATIYGDIAHAQIVPRVPVWSTVPATPAHLSFDAATGTATGTSAGTGDVVKATLDGISATSVVTVGYMEIDVACVDDTIPNSGTTTCTATAYDHLMAPIAGVTFTWDIAAGTAATVDASGVVTADASLTGAVTVRAHGSGDPTTAGTAVVTVAARAAAAVAIGNLPPANQMVEGTSRTLTATVTDQFGAPFAGATIDWSSSDAVLAVDSGGTITASATTSGSADITATVHGTAVADTVTIDVIPTPPVATTIDVAPTTATVTAGGTQQFTATVRDQYGAAMAGETVTWTSSDPAVATVDASGLATAVAAGSADVIAHDGAITGSGTLTVTAPVVDHVVVTPPSATATVGNTQQFTAQAFDASDAVIAGATFTWSSDDDTIATVDGAGLATAVAEGSATITATASGVDGTATFTVTTATPTVDHIVVTPDSATAQTGDTQQFTAEAFDDTDAVIAGVTFTWSSDDTGVATVDAAGLATAVGAGSTTITASAQAIDGTALFTVTDAPAVVDHVTIAPADVSAQVGDTQQLTATAFDADGAVISGATFTWSSDDDSVATVSSGGLVTAAGAGAATITATSGGVDGTSTITVTETSDGGCCSTGGTTGAGALFPALAVGLALLRRRRRG
jgi:MYXO-CTERM domain-containing protein